MIYIGSCSVTPVVGTYLLGSINRNSLELLPVLPTRMFSALQTALFCMHMLLPELLVIYYRYIWQMLESE